MKNESNEEKVNFQKHYQEVFYKEYYDAWKDTTHDDRIIFCNMYEIISNALDEMINIDSTMIWCGFYDELKEKRNMMNEIKERFKDRVKVA